MHIQMTIYSNTPDPKTAEQRLRDKSKNRHIRTKNNTLQPTLSPL